MAPCSGVTVRSRRPRPAVDVGLHRSLKHSVPACAMTRSSGAGLPCRHLPSARREGAGGLTKRTVQRDSRRRGNAVCSDSPSAMCSDSPAMEYRRCWRRTTPRKTLSEGPSLQGRRIQQMQRSVQRSEKRCRCCDEDAFRDPYHGQAGITHSTTGKPLLGDSSSA